MQVEECLVDSDHFNLGQGELESNMIRFTTKKKKKVQRVIAAWVYFSVGIAVYINSFSKNLLHVLKKALYEILTARKTPPTLSLTLFTVYHYSIHMNKQSTEGNAY